MEDIGPIQPLCRSPPLPKGNTFPTPPVAARLATPLMNCGVLPNPIQALSAFSNGAHQALIHVAPTYTMGEGPWVWLYPLYAKKQIVVVVVVVVVVVIIVVVIIV